MTETTGKVVVGVPEDPDLLCAIGRVTAAHANLELVLKMCVKSLAGLSVKEAMLAYDRANTSEVRECIRKLFRQSSDDEKLRCKLLALLGEAKKIAEDRNNLIHRPWAISKSGDLLSPDEERIWTDPPAPAELDNLAKRISDLACRLNYERLHGFIHDVTQQVTLDSGKGGA